MFDYNYTKQILLNKASISMTVFKYSSLLLPITTLLTLVGNSLCISALLINRRKWLKHHFYMFVMCFSDSFVLLNMLQYLFLHNGMITLSNDTFYVPFISTVTLYCKIVTALGLIGNSCSFTLTLCLAFDRLHALYYPFKYRTLSISYAIKVGCVLTLINIILSIIFVVYVEPYTIVDLNNNKYKFCWINPIKISLLLYITLSIIYTMYYKGFISVCLLFILNVILIHKTVNIIKGPKSIKSNHDNRSKELKNVAFSSCTIIILSTLYIGCISPLAIMTLVVNMREINPFYEDKYLHYIDQIGFALNEWTAEILVRKNILYRAFLIL